MKTNSPPRPSPAADRGGGSHGATRERQKDGVGGAELLSGGRGPPTRNMLKEQASQTRWSKVQPTAAAPHVNLVTCTHVHATQWHRHGRSSYISEMVHVR
jgi:hypothetical protein